ncbi:MAG: DUF4968 domain-containing protein [Nitriliruptoraceae bacterium]|nr:DUF4968 domain-containing protein [Nitriliruptoraceae bacterium]
MSDPTPDPAARDDAGGRTVFADAVVRDLDRPLICVDRIDTVEDRPGGVDLTATTTRIARRLRDRTGTALETADPIGPGPTARLRIELLDAHVVRIRAVLDADIDERPGPLLVTDPVVVAPAEHVAVQRTDTAITLTSAAVTVTIHRDPFHLEVRDADGRRLHEGIPASVTLSPPTGESHLDGRALSDAWPWFFRSLTPLGWVLDDDGRPVVSETSVLSQNEALFGLGERFLGLDKRGQRIDLWHANAAGQTWPESYKNVPLHLSTQGAGTFLNTTAPVTYHLGDSSATHQSWHVASAQLDWFLIHGPSFDEILDRYTALTGRPQLPPRWSYGLWMSRMSYRTQQEVEQVADDLRTHDIPTDVVHIDTDWFATPWVNDLTFCPQRFPDPGAMIERLRANDLRLTLWQLPYLSVRSRLYTEAAAHGYLAMRDGEVAHIGGFFGEAGVVDVTNPEAAAWYASRFDALFDLGVAAIKTDFGEGAPADAEWFDGDGVDVHNLYPLLYNRAIFERTLERTGEGLIWGRAATAGSQRYPVYWGGDPAARFEDLGNVLAGGLSLALCGFPFWSQDIGAFAGEPTERLYIRWAQAGLFMTHPRAHGAGPREPWAFGARAEELFRHWAVERYRLLPYLWSEAEALAPVGSPVMRPLVLDHTDDPTTYRIHDAFLLGRSLLVAPVVTAEDRRAVYLPAGDWVRWGTDEPHAGRQWLDVAAPLEELPRFLRAGAIILRADGHLRSTADVDDARLTATIAVPTDDVEHRASYVAVAGHTVEVSQRRDAATLRVEVPEAVGAIDVCGAAIERASMDGVDLAVDRRARGARIATPGPAGTVQILLAP